MALWVCRECTTAYAVGLPACPHCGATSYRPDWEEDDMAKITTAEGPTNALAAPGELGHVPPAPEGGEQPSPDPGTSSSTSTSKPAKSSTGTSPTPRQPAPTTESPSSQDQTPKPEQGSPSTASTTDGSTPATGSGRKGSDLKDLLA